MNETNYKNQQRKLQQERLTNPIFEGARNMGIFSGKQRQFVICYEDSLKNLYAPIRQDALEYFERYNIAWWHQYEDRCFPTGHLLSSQIHCLNHLFAIRKNHDAVLAMIQTQGEKVGVHFDKVLPSPIDTQEGYFDKELQKPVSNSNFISFEFVCHNIDMLNETHESRGKNCTSVDAFIYARAGKEYWLIPIEWKYTESYDPAADDVHNYSRYISFVGSNSRLLKWSNLFKKEPFYEFGRQTLLMEQLIANHPIVGKVSKQHPEYLHPLKADKFLHLIVVPNGNTELRADVKKFQAEIKEDARPYCMLLSPEELLNPLKQIDEYAPLVEYLETRYWL